MNKKGQNEHTKKLVRNVEGAVPKVTVRNEASKEKIVKSKPVDKKCAKTTSVPNFQEPRIHSTSTLAKQIETLENLRLSPSKSATNIAKNDKLAVSEKVTRRVNFPYNKPIYKDLMPLCVKSTSAAQVTKARKPLTPKDIEPQLSDFITTKKLPEFAYIVNLPSMVDAPEREANLLRLTSKINKWSDF